MKNYKTLRQIGQGGMSKVFLARQMPQNRLVAVKILTGADTSNPEYIKRFFREARITARLSHPNIIEIIESNFSSEENLFYIVTLFMEGGSFSSLMKQEEITIEKKLHIMHKVLQALYYAHKNGVIHRDIKPSNILLSRKQEPKLCDFGIATALWGQESQLTRTNEVMGTMDYIAPEQKESSRNVDARADIYSIGVILYQLITGRKPQGAFPPPQQLVHAIPATLNALVMKCLQPMPNDRYKNARNLADDLWRNIEKINSHHSSQHLPPVAPKPVTGSIQEKTFMLSGEPQMDVQEKFQDMIGKIRDGGIAEKLRLKPLFLESVNESHKDILMQLLTECQGFLKEAVIEALGKLKIPESCAHLIELLSDPYYNKIATAAIGEIGCKEAEEKLFKMLLTHSENSYTALIPLAKINSVRSIDLIAQYLTDRHIWVRQLALDALAMIDDPEGGGNEKIKNYLETISNNDADANIRAGSKKILWRFKK